jgi:hypothetical protein
MEPRSKCKEKQEFETVFLQLLGDVQDLAMDIASCSLLSTDYSHRVPSSLMHLLGTRDSGLGRPEAIEMVIDGYRVQAKFPSGDLGFSASLSAPLPLSPSPTKRVV